MLLIQNVEILTVICGELELGKEQVEKEKTMKKQLLKVILRYFSSETVDEQSTEKHVKVKREQIGQRNSQPISNLFFKEFKFRGKQCCTQSFKVYQVHKSVMYWSRTDGPQPWYHGVSRLA